MIETASITADIDETMAQRGWYPLLPKSRRIPAELDIQAFEQRLGSPLPEPYRTFLLKYGRGALAERSYFPIAETCPWGSFGQLSEILGFTTNPRTSIESTAVELRADRIPQETIPIAVDAKGNLLLLGVVSPFKGQVFFWDHEHRELTITMDEVHAQLTKLGVSTRGLSEHKLMRAFYDSCATTLQKPRGFENVYRVCRSLAEFVASWKSEPW